MLPARFHHSILRSPFLAIFTFTLLFGPVSYSRAQQSTDILPLSEVHPGMQGYAYTIFAGDQIEKFDLEVLGIMPNFLGPKQSIILVQLKGPKVEHTGVVAGMSGSPVYLDGKLAGALSLKLGIFTKEPIAGVTPIADVLNPPVPSSASQPARSGQNTAQQFSPPSLPNDSSSNPANDFAAQQITLPSGAALEPIETPLVFSGFQASALRQFSSQLQSYGFVAAQGGTAAPRPDDSQLKPGDMAGMVLVQGDASINSACTVTAVQADRVFLCGHPFLSLGDVQIPMARSRVLATLSSDMASTKIVNVGGSIGTITGDHLTAVTGKLGMSPAMIPLELTLSVAGAEKQLHFQLVNHPRLTPILVALTTFSGLTQNSLYGEGTTLHLSGEIQLKNHAPVQIENTFAPGDALSPDGLPIALTMQSIFSRLFTNNFEATAIERVSLRVESVPGRHSFTIESAWLEKGEAAPGETLRVRVLLRPYRGPAQVQETTVRVPDQVTRGTMLRVLVSDADMLNRASRGFAATGAGASASLDQLIALLNRERRNDRLYVGLFAPSPTMLWEDKELPNVPLSQINIVDGRPAPGTVQVLRESLSSESSIPLGGPVAGVISLNLQIR
ncbi:MAG TPA: SpoIVB peptidase S55 domain-containing protein [Verrucomicrobiae bacterium]|nr:SpoIVB peptidase S55 domain-containing protein [Verrucomicrobiae bacterium]